MSALTSKGFTLIEMMIAVSLLVVIAGFTIVGITTFNQNQGIEDDAKKMVSEFRRVYSRATGIFYPSGCTGRITGYTVTAPSPVGTDSLRIDTVGCAVLVREERLDVLKSSYISSGATFTINSTDGRIAGSPITVTITSNTDATLTEQIRISDFGVIEIL